MTVSQFLDFPFSEFDKNFPDENTCLEKLAELKWGDGFVCRNCGHSHFCEGKYPFSRRCTKCKKEETVKANTVFSSCKLPLNLVFKMMNYSNNQTSVSAHKLCLQFGVREMTCWKIKKNLHKHILSTDEIKK